MLQGDGEKQQDVPYSPPHLLFIIFYSAYCFHRGKTNEYTASGESGSREKREG